MDKVHGIPGNTKHGEPDSPRELLRKDQWMNGWRSSSQTISFEQGLGHLKHVVQAIESEELKAHLKTTGILFKSVQYEFSKLNEKVGGIKQHVDSSLGGMITKTQAATILSNQKDLQKSQELLHTKMEAMESKLELLLSFLLVDDAKKGEKIVVTKCGPELQSFSEDREGGGTGGSGKGKAVVTSTAAVQTTGTVAGSSQEAGGSSSGQEKKKCDEMVESVDIANPDSSTIPDGGTTTNPDGSIPDEQGNINTDEQEIVAAHDVEELNPELEDEQKAVSKLKKYVYLNKMLSTEEIQEAVHKALTRYIYDIKQFKDRWRKPVPAEKDVDRRRNFPPLPRKESKFTPDYQIEIKFIPESGVVQGQHEQRYYKFS